jgi:osomolarity two-component system phosphorelay intermediate protein YPD1
LSSLGHFLKGSSATLGFVKVKDSCQVIQQYGHKLKVDGSPEPDEKVCLAKIAEAIQLAKDDMAKLETMLKKFFGEGSD